VDGVTTTNSKRTLIQDWIEKTNAYWTSLWKRKTNSKWKTSLSKYWTIYLFLLYFVFYWSVFHDCFISRLYCFLGESNLPLSLINRKTLLVSDPTLRHAINAQLNRGNFFVCPQISSINTAVFSQWAQDLLRQLFRSTARKQQSANLALQAKCKTIRWLFFKSVERLIE